MSTLANLNTGVFNPDVVDGGVLDPGNSFNYIDDLATWSFNGVPFKMDEGTDDTLVGTAGRDMITVNNGNDTVHAGLDDDVVKDLGGGNDQLFGDGGNDRFVMGAGNDFVDGGTGIDTLDYTGIAFTVVADLSLGQALADGLDQFTKIENVIGSEWNDTLKGSSGNNVLYGMGGNDKINGAGGLDSLFGGEGNDTIIGNGGLYGGNGDDILASSGIAPGAPGDILHGEDGDDTMTASSGNDRLYGGDGDDKLMGNRGSDLLHGGIGENVLTGGQGSDTFLFDPFGVGHGHDTITDFNPRYDTIDLSLIDANPTLAGHQDFIFSNNNLHFDDEVLNTVGSPELRGFLGRVSSVIDEDRGLTFVYVQTQTGLTSADIVLRGEFNLTEDNFVL